MNEVKSKEAAVTAVKIFAKNVSVTAEVVFSAINGNINGTVLNKVFSIMSDTTSLDTGKVSGVNKRLTDFYMKYHGRNIHSLECLFYVNEIYLSHIIAKIEGKKKGPGTSQEVALMKHFADIQKPDIRTIVDREKRAVSITNIASFHLKKAEWFFDRKKINEHQFRNDHMC